MSAACPPPWSHPPPLLTRALSSSTHSLGVLVSQAAVRNSLMAGSISFLLARSVSGRGSGSVTGAGLMYLSMMDDKPLRMGLSTAPSVFHNMLSVLMECSPLSVMGDKGGLKPSISLFSMQYATGTRLSQQPRRPGGEAWMDEIKQGQAEQP